MDLHHTMPASACHLRATLPATAAYCNLSVQHLYGLLPACLGGYHSHCFTPAFHHFCKFSPGLLPLFWRRKVLHLQLHTACLTCTERTTTCLDSNASCATCWILHTPGRYYRHSPLPFLCTTCLHLRGYLSCTCWTYSAIAGNLFLA